MCDVVERGQECDVGGGGEIGQDCHVGGERSGV